MLAQSFRVLKRPIKKSEHAGLVPYEGHPVNGQDIGVPIPLDARNRVLSQPSSGHFNHWCARPAESGMGCGGTLGQGRATPQHVIARRREKTGKQPKVAEFIGLFLS